MISKYASVVGWGYTEYDPLVRQKQGDFLRAGVANQVQQQLELPIISTYDCQKKFEDVFSPVESQLCAGGEIGRDSCKVNQRQNFDQKVKAKLSGRLRWSPLYDKSFI